MCSACTYRCKRHTCWHADCDRCAAISGGAITDLPIIVISPTVGSSDSSNGTYSCITSGYCRECYPGWHRDECRNSVADGVSG
jgi:hypothetical protein